MLNLFGVALIIWLGALFCESIINDDFWGVLIHGFNLTASVFLAIHHWKSNK
jgi:hypothetical protein